MGTDSGRVVLCRKGKSMVKFLWTGAEPSGMFEVEVAEELGARWEGDELVTYDLSGWSPCTSITRETTT